MKKTLMMLACLLATGAASAYAQPANFDQLPYAERKAAMKALSSEERKALYEQKRARWQQMSNAEKLQMIEKKRAERLNYMNQKWNSMSDAEKIAYIERKWDRKKKMHSCYGSAAGAKDKNYTTPPRRGPKPGIGKAE